MADARTLILWFGAVIELRILPIYVMICSGESMLKRLATDAENRWLRIINIVNHVDIRSV